MRNSTLGRAALCAVLAALAACNNSGPDSSSTAAATSGATSSSGAAANSTSSTANAMVALSSPVYTVSANAATAVITVDRIGPSTGQAFVEYATVNGTATAGTDYTPASGSLFWTDGDTAPKTISVPVFGGKRYGKIFLSHSLQ
jgi:hypothetical protein